MHQFFPRSFLFLIFDVADAALFGQAKGRDNVENAFQKILRTFPQNRWVGPNQIPLFPGV